MNRSRRNFAMTTTAIGTSDVLTDSPLYNADLAPTTDGAAHLVGLVDCRAVGQHVGLYSNLYPGLGIGGFGDELVGIGADDFRR